LPLLRFGKIGGGDESVVKDESLRHLISEKYGVCCFDSGIDQVMDSIEGNRKDSFIVIKGIVDYADGTTTKEWQPYAALCAAAFAKTIIASLPPTDPSKY
jgi:nucleoside phosphorylase